MQGLISTQVQRIFEEILPVLDEVLGFLSKIVGVCREAVLVFDEILGQCIVFLMVHVGPLMMCQGYVKRFLCAFMQFLIRF